MEANSDLKQRYDYEIKRYHRYYLDTIGKEQEEYFSNKLFDLFNSYEKKIGEKHPLENAINHEAELRRSEVGAKQEKTKEFLNKLGVNESNMKNEKDRMKEYGKNGLEYLLRNMEKKVCVDKFEKLL